jgi:16S rRNA C967 or C1407 C5-methylase (RsmB/RsmF family)
LSQKQYALLCAALLVCQTGGKIVYSTCSINPVENDLVIEKLLNKKSDFVELDSIEIPFLGAKKTQYGWMIRPDTFGFGPIYVSKLSKK